MAPIGWAVLIGVIAGVVLRVTSPSPHPEEGLLFSISLGIVASIFGSAIGHRLFATSMIGSVISAVVGIISLFAIWLIYR